MALMLFFVWCGCFCCAQATGAASAAATVATEAPRVGHAVANAATLEQDILLAFREKFYWKGARKQIFTFIPFYIDSFVTFDLGWHHPDDALATRVNQPHKDVLAKLKEGKLCQKVTSGQFRYHWELKPEYKDASAP